MSAKFEIRLSKDEQFYFVLKARNGEIILVSEMYTSKQNCEKGILSVVENSPNDDNYKRLEASNGQDYFNLVAANGEIIGTSEMYESKQGRDKGIESVKVNGPVGTVEDAS